MLALELRENGDFKAVWGPSRRFVDGAARLYVVLCVFQGYPDYWCSGDLQL